MGRKVNWFCAVNKALSSEDSKENKDQRSGKSKKKWFMKKKKSSHSISKSGTATNNITTTTTTTTAATTPTTSLPLVAVVPVETVKQIPILPPDNVKIKEEKEEEEEDEQKKHAQSIAIATAKAAEAAAAAAQAAAEVVRLTNAAQLPSKIKEDAAALRIQSAFRIYLARRALCALRGLAGLKIVMQGQSINHQTTSTYKSMQSLARVQSQVRARRLGMSEDKQAQKGQILENRVRDVEQVENLQQNESGWNDSPKSKDQIDARLQSQHEVAIRRERALAYSLNHQQTWRNSPTSKAAKTRLMESKNEQQSGWSWLERWLAGRPWESADNPLGRTSIHDSSTSQIAKAILQHVSSEKQTSASSSPRGVHNHKRGRLSTSIRVSSRKPKSTKPASPKASPRRSLCCPDDDSNAGSSDDNYDSLATSPAAAQAVPSYMAPTESARAKSRLGNTLTQDTIDRLSVCSAKKRASSPARSRNSVSSITDANSIAEHQSLINAM